MNKYLILNLALACGLFLASCDALLKMAEGVPVNVDPTTSEIITGLKTALTNGTGNAVSILNQAGGYLNDPLVKIPFPSEAEFAANTLRDLGFGNLVDNFVEKLNEGAEKGAAMAVPIFKNAIKQMTFADAKNILLGPDNAATLYFQEKTEIQLADAFRPHIQSTLDQVNATQIWNELTTRYNSIPLVRKKVETDIVKYATGRALSGLFLKLADEEKKIREQPLARTSEILKKVFGYADRQKGNG